MRSLPESPLRLAVVSTFTFATLLLTAYETLSAPVPTLTIADGIESARAMVDAENQSVFLSPDGAQYALMLIKGDLKADGLWADVMVGRVVPGQQAQPRRVARFFTRGLGPSIGFALYGSTALTNPQENVPVWLDNRRIALLWEDPHGVIQVVCVDTSTGDTSFLTNSATDVLGFSAHASGTIVYDALVVHSRKVSEKLLHNGFSVTNPDALPLVAGYVDGTSMFDFMNCDRFVVARADRQTRRVPIASPFHCGSVSFLLNRLASHNPLFSPDGRKLVLNALVDHVPDEWSEYTDVNLKAWIREHHDDPTGLAAKLLQSLVVVDANTGIARPLWNAPFNASAELSLVWSTNGTSLLVWPAFLPPAEADQAGLAGNAIAEVDIESGRSTTVPLAEHLLPEIKGIRFAHASNLEIELKNNQTLRFAKSHDRWHQLQSHSRATPGRAENVRPPRARIELRQDMNAPPALYVVTDRGKVAERILDLNPKFANLTLGKVEIIYWKDDSKREWRGRLYYPVNYEKGRRYPLVIQARCFADETQFSVYGCGDNYPTTGPGWSSFIAQTLAGNDIAVLQLSAPIGGIDEPGKTIEWSIQTALEAGWRAAAEHLIDIGLTERNRVGVMGFSLTGWVVEYVLSHSQFPYAAAIASDHGNMGYMQASLNGWPIGPSNAAGAAPFGDGLAMWKKNAPVFNVEEIHTPLQLQLTSSGEQLTNLLWHWELFSRLRHLRKPVEYYVAPDVQHGSHTLQNPRQLFTLQGRALDWWCFWLKGEERITGEKQEQYNAWRELRKLHEENMRARVSQLKSSDDGRAQVTPATKQ